MIKSVIADDGGAAAKKITMGVVAIRQYAIALW